MCNNSVPTPSENWLPAMEASKNILSKNKEIKYLNKKKCWYFCNLQWFSQTSQNLEKHLTASGLKAMDSIHCLVWYNLQTLVLSTTTQKMKLVSKYIAEKQLRRTEQLLYIIQKVMASMRENNFLQSARARRTSNKPNNMKAMKKICMPFFTVTSSAVVCDMEIGPYMHLPSKETVFMWLCWVLIISDYKSDSSWETRWRKVRLCCWSCSYYGYGLRIISETLCSSVLRERKELPH